MPHRIGIGLRGNPTAKAKRSNDHGGKGVPVTGATAIENDAAVTLLSDAIAFNPALRVALVPLLRSIGR